MIVLERQIRGIVAAYTMRQFGIGHFARAARAIGVERPQDVVDMKGQGIIKQVKDNKVYGENTKFSILTAGSKLKLANNTEIIIEDIVSDIYVTAKGNIINIQNINQEYKYRFKINYQQFFNETWKALKNGQCIAIFPEGTSHEMLQMRNFKTGIVIMALGAIDKYGIKVNLVPCGFSQYKQYNYRSKMAMEFGEPHIVPDQIVQLYKTDQKQAISQLLILLRNKLRNLTVQFDSFDQLPALMLTRQLYTLSLQRQVSFTEKVRLNRQFAKALMMAKSSPKYEKEYQKLLKFSDFVQSEGISVRSKAIHSNRLSVCLMLILSLLKSLFYCILMLPGIILWGPTAIFGSKYAQRVRQWEQKNYRPHEHNYYIVGGIKMFVGGCLLVFFICILFCILSFCTIGCLRKVSQNLKDFSFQLHCIFFSSFMAIYFQKLLINSQDKRLLSNLFY